MNVKELAAAAWEEVRRQSYALGRAFGWLVWVWVALLIVRQYVGVAPVTSLPVTAALFIGTFGFYWFGLREWRKH